MSHNSEVNDITRYVLEHWIAVTLGYLCTCGHEHHGRELHRDGARINMAPQYGFCDDEACECRTLHRAS